MASMANTAVFGSVFVDIKGFPFGEYHPKERNVGDVKIVHGGVCRNVAENLANVGSPVTLVTMFEPGGMGEDVRRRLAARGVDMKYAVTAEASMGMWLVVLDESGDVAGSISRQPDFSPMENLVDARGDEIVSECGAVVLEVDMRASIAEKVFALAEKHGKDVYVLVGNMSVILQRPELLSKVRLFILNENELGRLAERSVDPARPGEVMAVVREVAAQRRIREMIVTLGAHGAVYYDSETGESGHVPAERVRMVDSSGAGDAFFSGAVAARIDGKSLAEAARLGTRLAALTVQSEESNCPRLEGFLET